MHSLKKILLLVMALGLPTVARPAIQLVQDEAPLQLFGGDTRSVSRTWQNPGGGTIAVDVYVRLSQIGSTIAAPVDLRFWKRVELLPGQRAIEAANLVFPEVRAETRFLIQWLEDTNRVIGITEVLLYPTNLLLELAAIAGDAPLGVIDPGQRLKPLLQSLPVEFQDLQERGFEGFAGRCAVVGPVSAASERREHLAEGIKMFARRGGSIVWIQPAPGLTQQLNPSYYMVPEGTGMVVVAQEELVSRLGEDPRAQLNLLRLARLALHPEPPRLP